MPKVGNFLDVPHFINSASHAYKCSLKWKLFWQIKTRFFICAVVTELPRVLDGPRWSKSEARLRWYGRRGEQGCSAFVGLANGPKKKCRMQRREKERASKSEEDHADRRTHMHCQVQRAPLGASEDARKELGLIEGEDRGKLAPRERMTSPGECNLWRGCRSLPPRPQQDWRAAINEHNAIMDGRFLHISWDVIHGFRVGKRTRGTTQ